MTFNVFSTRTVGETADGAMFPALNDDGKVGREQLDGDRSQHLVATSIAVREVGANQTRSIMELSDIQADLFITDARLIMMCAKYDKGGGWFGSPGMALALNAVSKVLASRRSRGTVLVGHVRYPWLSSVAFSPKQGWLDEETLRLVVRDGTASPSRLLLVDLALPKTADSAAIARAIMLRAVAYRTTHEELNEAEQAGFRALEASNPPRPQPKKFASFTMPTSWNAMPSTAYPRTESA
ncbi:hypothetical protein ABZS29_21390 [Kribbella sp. NPDC005582]|uniref:hypothetical protein n=1 Tax=Kribbella sp. NPDC005582 TaxID=3156893 RepID=UPI0033A8043B